MRHALILPFLTLAPAALAEPVVTDCAKADARFVAEPWEDNIASFADTNVRLAVFDFFEPAGAPVYLMILSPPRNEIGERQCVMIGFGRLGFYSADLTAVQADYDPATGLSLRLPVELPPTADQPIPAILSVSVEQDSGEVAATVE